MSSRKNTVPLSKLATALEESQRYFEAIISKSDPESLNLAIQELRLKAKAEEESAKKISPTLKKIICDLQQYPGLQQDIGNYLRMRIASYQKLGILDKFKTVLTESKVTEKKESKAKSSNAESLKTN